MFDTGVYPERIFEKVNLEKINQQMTKDHEKLPGTQSVNSYPANIFVLKMLSAFLHLLHKLYSSAIQTSFYQGSKHHEPRSETAPLVVV